MELAGYKVTVRPDASYTCMEESREKCTLTVGKRIVMIENDELFVSDKYYGPLKKGDTILVEDSIVTVSGEVRQAAD